MRLNFTRSLLLTVLASVLLFSCKKDSSDSDYYLKFKVNGNWITWSKAFAELGPDLGDSSKTNFGLAAYKDDQSEAFDMAFQVDGPNLNTGTYNSTMYLMPIDYTKNANASNAVSYRIGTATGRSESEYTVTLTSITDNVIKGHFTGNYLVNVDDETVEITEGEFVLQRIR